MSASESGMTAEVTTWRSDIVGVNRMRLLQIRRFAPETKYCFVLWPSHLTKLTSDCSRSCETDADRPNVELARHRRPVARRDAQPRAAAEGVGRDPPDRRAAGLGDRRLRAAGLRAVTLARHDEAAERRFHAEVPRWRTSSPPTAVAGETDALLMIVARDVAELQRRRSRGCPRAGARSG